MADSAQETAASLIHMLNTKGQGDYIGEPISQLEHSLQAAHLAKVNSADNETIIAALLHDVGQFLPAQEVKAIAHEVQSMKPADADSDGGVGRVGHESIGEQYLNRLGFSQKVSFLVGSHVAAKRYLCTAEPGYHDTLSEASKKSLQFQGGPMQGAEFEEWSANPWSAEMCRLRKWDDGAKVVGLNVEPAEVYQDMIVQHLQRRQQQH
jgi:2-amino-1-hydroxyethylphosphonate dioxygenase (glycine-forming)